VSKKTTGDSLFRDTYLPRWETCEWCDSVAQWKYVVSPKYERYSCDDLPHLKKTQHLVKLDGHNECSVVFRSDGFKLEASS